MSFDAGAIEARMQLSLNEWKASVEAVKKDQGNMAKAADEHSGALKGLWLQFAGGLTVVALASKTFGFVKDTIKDSIREAAAYEKALSTLDATFIASGRNMPGMTQHLKDYARELQALGLADDMAILKSETLLLRMTNLNEAGIKEGTRLAAGLAYVYGIDLDSATTLIGKGMEGVYRGFISLCPAIMNATTETGKHEAMMKFLNDTYIAAQAQIKTYAGELKNLGLEWDDAKKGFGEAILSTGILQRGLEEATDILREFTEATRSHKGEAEKEIEVQNKRYEALKEVAKGMGISSIALINLIIQHDGLTDGISQGNKATYDWIKAGGLGKEAQELLAKAVENQNKKLADQKKGFTETGKGVSEYAEKLEALKKELNLTFTTDIQKKIDDIQLAIKVYGQTLPESEVRRLMAEQRKLNDELTTGGLVLGMVEQRLKLLEKPLEVVTAHMEALGKIGAEAAGKMGIESRNMVEPVKSAWQECSTVISDAMRDIARSIVDAFGLVEALAYKPVDYEKTGTADYFKKVYGDLKADYEARKKAIEDNISDEDDRNKALAELNEWYAGEQDRIRGDEDIARDKHADDERKRQESLWEDVKKIFGTACENMATIFLTKMFEPIGNWIGDLAKKFINDLLPSAKTVVDKVGDLGKEAFGAATSVGNMAGSFLSSLGSIGGIVSGVVSLIELLKGPQKQTDVTYWLKRIDDKTQEIHDCLLNDYKGYFNDFYNFLSDIKRFTSDTVDAVYGVKNAINDLESFQHGGYVPETGLAMLHAGEYVVPPAANQGFVNAAVPAMAGGPSPVINNYITFNIEAIDGPSVDRLVKGPVCDILDDVYRQNKKGLTTNLNKYLKAMA